MKDLFEPKTKKWPLMRIDIERPPIEELHLCKHITEIPNPCSGDVYRWNAVAMAVERIDDAIMKTIAEVARETGIDTVFLMDKQFVADALREKLEGFTPLEFGPATSSNDPLYVECRSNGAVFCADVVIDQCGCVRCDRFGDLPSLWLPFIDYNRTWRCWTRRPTDKERAAAKWEAQL